MERPPRAHHVPRRRPALVAGAVALAFAGGVALAPRPARAEAAPAGDELWPAALHEATCTLDVTARGAIATFVRRVRIVNAAATPAHPHLVVRLPPAARVVGLRIDGQAALPVEPTDAVAAPTSVLDADLAYLRAQRADGEASRYVADLAALRPRGEVVVELTWVAPVVIADGAIRIPLPGRGAAPNLSGCVGVADVVAGPGVDIEAPRLAGRPLPGRGRSPFVLDDPDGAWLEAPLRFHRDQPVLWLQRQDLGDGTQALAVTIATPPARRAAAVRQRRLALVVDRSRSMALVGPAAVATLVRSLAAALPADAEIEAITFDRTARRVLGGWRRADPQGLAHLVESLTQDPTSGGTDLAAALRLARAALAEDDRHDGAIALITDGALAPDPTTAAELLAALPAAAHVPVYALVINRRELAEADDAALARLVALDGGALTRLDVEGLAAGDDRGAARWLRPAWADVALDGRGEDGGHLSGLASATLAAGHGVVIVDHHAADPRRTASLTVTARRGSSAGGEVVQVAAAPGPAVAFAALALDEDASDAARRRWPLVDDRRALVVPARSTAVGKSRAQMLAGGGPFTWISEAGEAWARGRPAVVHVATVVTRGELLESHLVHHLVKSHLIAAAHGCYQRALGHGLGMGTGRPVAGTMELELWLGRGEVIAARAAGLGDPALDACVLDAAYALPVPLPDPALHRDELVHVRYPLRFTLPDEQPTVVLGDADSAEPLPRAALPIVVDANAASTPLGDLPPPTGPVRTGSRGD